MTHGSRTAHRYTIATLALPALLACAGGTDQATEDAQRDPAAIAASLTADFLTRTPVRTSPAETTEQGRLVQVALVQALTSELGPVVGYKAGLTSSASQEAFGMDQPVRGTLLERMLVPSGTVVAADFGVRPMYEGDLVVRVGNPAINDAVTDQELVSALDAVIPFVELPDLTFDETVRIDGPRLTAVNVGSRLGVRGSALPLADGDEGLAQLAGIELELIGQDGELIDQGASTSLLGHPINVVRWIRDSLAEDGVRLETGHVLSLGSMTSLHPVRAGSSVTARYHGVGPDPVEVRVTFAEVGLPDRARTPTVAAANAFYYYADVAAAHRFYTRVLGLETTADYGFAKIMRVSPSSYLTLVDAAEGMHSADEPKTVTLALVTDEVEDWYAYLDELGVPMRAELNASPAQPHDGFVAIDPEGYFLEFERFNEHPENERLMPLLDRVDALDAAVGTGTTRPSGLGIRATVLWLYYDDLQRAQSFYERTMDLPLIVDQGWAKVYPVSSTGFLGLVDGARGLHSATDEKAVTVSFFVDDVEAWLERMRGTSDFRLRTDGITGESGRVRVFVGYDPEGYFLEWDTFLDVPGNEALLERLQGR